MEKKENGNTYWKSNLKILSILLSIWFIVSFCGSILFVDQLDRIKIMGVKLGFWLAQQGSIIVFFLLVVLYIFLMSRLDKKTHLSNKK